MALADTDKANLLNAHFSTIGKKLSEALPLSTDKGQAANTVAPQLSEFSVSEKAVRRKINTLKQNKSAGPDNIKSKLLKLASDAIAPALVDLYNYSTERETVFSAWKTARLNPIFKKLLEQATPQNYC